MECNIQKFVDVTCAWPLRLPGAHTVFYVCLFSTGLMVYLAGSSISSYVCPEKYDVIEAKPDWRRKVEVDQVSGQSLIFEAS